MLPKWNLADIRARMFNRPLMVSIDKAQIALGVMGPRLDIGALILTGDAAQRLSMDQLRAQAAAAKAQHDSLPGDDDLKKFVWVEGVGLVERDPYEIWNGVAIFQVRGTLMAENGIDPASGATGYDGLGFKCRHAEVNPEVRGAILDIDSGGGEVVDLQELCSQLRAFAEKKPLRAIVRGQACSAAYALAACAGPGNITAAPYSVVGSIGAIMLHADFSKQLEEEGIDVTLITSAAHKADASQLKPLEADVEARLKAMVDECASTFIDHVADARSVARASIEAQEARFYSGQDALDLGLVDKFMPWDESMREFAQRLSGGSSRTSTTAPIGARSSKGTSMGTEANAPAAELQAVISQADLEAAVTTARAEAAAAERERISAIAELDGVAFSETASASISEGTSAGDFAIALTRASKAKVDAAAAAAKNEAVSPTDLPEGSAAAAAPGDRQPQNRGAAYAAKKAAQAKA